jgi:hypothetical protein
VQNLRARTKLRSLAVSHALGLALTDQSRELT